MNNFLKNNKGSVLFMTMLILISMLTVVLGAANLIVSRIAMSGIQERSTRAYIAAESGIEKALWEIRQSDLNVNDCSLNDYINFTSSLCQSSEYEESLSNGASYRVIYSNTSPVIFTSTGIFNNLRRSVDIVYSF